SRPSIRRRMEEVLRRPILMVVTMSLTLLVASGVALAVTKIGTNGPDTLKGTNAADTLIGKNGNDRIFGLRGNDNVVGGDGNDLVADGILQEHSTDTLSGGDGNDVILVDNQPATRDLVVCGSGFDRVQADRADQLAPDCEFAVVVHGSYEDIIRQEERFQESVPASFYEGLPPL